MNKMHLNLQLIYIPKTLLQEFFLGPFNTET